MCRIRPLFFRSDEGTNIPAVGGLNGQNRPQKAVFGGFLRLITDGRGATLQPLLEVDRSDA